METLLTRAARAKEEYELAVSLESYQRRRKEALKREVKALAEAVVAMPVRPMKEERFFVVAERNGKRYVRRRPMKPPTPEKAATWSQMARLAKLASRLSKEEVARLVDGKVVDVGEYKGDPALKGKKAILVDGQLLTPTQAIMKLAKNRRYVDEELRRLERLASMLRWALGLER